ncbi:unnamed protein product [Mytilus coruscus]|uniref:CARD domain-containing protein n=1 Tax=Mytilus coruscus TaxID=42192 RepID=A0A6J8BA82_MYTCO|nr:unnamed protein product [Mytilus coruscus]
MATKEEDNFLRIVYLNYRVGTIALRRYFDGVHPNLTSDLSSPSNKAILASLNKPPRGQKRVLFQEQWNVLYLLPGSPVVSSADLDVTLMVCLLRNLPPTVSPPVSGFDALPQSNDSTHGAHIARIKYYKNFIVSHSKDGKLSDNDFNTIWIDLEMAIHGLGNQQDNTDAADAKSKVLDHNALREQVNFRYNIQHNLKRLNDHSNELSVQTSKIRKLELNVENIEKEVQSVKKDINVKTSKGAFKEFKDKLVYSTILDKEVLDNLISKCILTVDDREEIDSFTDQLSRNQKLLEILMHRPYNTFNIFVEAMKESEQECNTLLVADLESIVTDKILILKNVPTQDDIAGVDKQTVKLIKWYKILVHELDIDKPGILAKLSAKDLTSKNDDLVLISENRTPQEKIRTLLGEIIRKNASSTYTAFLEFLKEDSCYVEYVFKLEDTYITQFDLELLFIDFMIDRIEMWRKDDSLFIERRATNHVLSSISNYKCVSVIGSSGCGKTALVRHVALIMERNGYTIITVTDEKEIKDQYKSDRKTLYIIDDMCGNFTVNQSRIEEWKKSIKDIESVLENSKYKLILTCRLQVFQDKGFENLEIFKRCECNLSSESLTLTSDEKEKMSRMYFKEHALEALKYLGQYEFFPLLCKLYNIQKANPQFTMEMFLNDPFTFYKKDLTHMYNDCKEVIFNNKLDETHLTGKYPKLKEYINDIKEVCDIHENITGRTIKTQLELLTGTFVTNEKGVYQTIHDKLFDFLAFYFGTQEQFLCLLIENANGRFLRERFVVSNNTQSAQDLIPITADKLQMYMKRVFNDMVTSTFAERDINENRNFKKFEFRNKLFDFVKHLTNQEKSELIKTADIDFLSTMFVMKENDIEGNFDKEYTCKWLSVVISDDLLQQYIEKWFDHLTKSDQISCYIEKNRLMMNVTFRTAFRNYMTQLNVEQIASLIETGTADFLTIMFVMTEDDINDISRMGDDPYGIVIPDELLHRYIEKWFDHLTDSIHPNTHMAENRPLMNDTFCTAFRSYIKQLNTEKIAYLIQTTSDFFLSSMFVMADDDIKDSAQNRHECFGIVIPDNLLLQFIDRWFYHLTKSSNSLYFIRVSRPLMSVTFRTALHTYTTQIKKEAIAPLIQYGDCDLLNSMFVMSDDDINDNAENRNECFGVVIPDDLLQKYIEKWFDHLTKNVSPKLYVDRNRLFMNVTFRTALLSYTKQLRTETIATLIKNGTTKFINTMFVMKENDIKDNAENRNECLGIVIPVDLLQQYIERWFGDLTKSRSPKNFVNDNRSYMNVKFRTALRSYMKQLNTKTIAGIFKIGRDEFLNTLFVMTEDDIKENAENRLDNVGIVIPDDMFQQYIERWFDGLVKSSSVNNYICVKDDINDNAENRYECFGIIIPIDLLQLYIGRLIDVLTKTDSVRKCLDVNRCFMNATFGIALQSYIKQLTRGNIANFIREGSRDFVNTMFVLAEDDIKKDSENRQECFGIIIPDDLLQQYIERWFVDMTKSDSPKQYIDENRTFMNSKFQAALDLYINGINLEKIGCLNRKENIDYLNTRRDLFKENKTCEIKN